MIVNQLLLLNFKNHAEQKFDFSPQINCFVGNNGVGKTNILDALHYLSVGKSFLGNKDAQNVKNEEDFYVIDAEIKNEDREDILKVIYSKDSKKIIKKNDKSYERMADHVGYLPSVIISPYDSNLISDAGESRRKFLDSMISQTDSEYLFNLIHYQKAVQQRNALLKYFFKNRTFDLDSLEIYNHPISEYGTQIFEKRKAFVEQLNPIVQYFYEIISGGKEVVNVGYESHLLEANYEQLLKENIEKDRQVTYTSKGIHKDDLVMQLGDFPIKREGSQGQNKTYLIALKLAQFDFLKRTGGSVPLLLLDDIFDKLDASRVEQIVKLVSGDSFGQIFITDTNREHLDQILLNLESDHSMFLVEKGEVQLMKEN